MIIVKTTRHIDQQLKESISVESINDIIDKEIIHNLSEGILKNFKESIKTEKNPTRPGIENKELSLIVFDKSTLNQFLSEFMNNSNYRREIIEKINNI